LQPIAAENDRFANVVSLLDSSVAEGVFPGAVLLVGHEGRVVFSTAVGRYGIGDRRSVSDSTVYDLASVTKVLGLACATLMLTAEGKLDLDRPVAEYLPRFRGPMKDQVAVRHLLTHTSGLTAWRPFHLETQTRAEAIDSILAAELEFVPGTRYLYSDLGAITLTLIVESVAGESIDRLLERRVYRPLGMDWTRYRPPAQWIDRIAPTEDDPWRGRVVRGEVHDENTVRLGGVSGHAGLFSIAPDLARYAQWMLDGYHGRLAPSSEPYVTPELVRMFVTRQPGPDGAVRALGWDTPSAEGSSAGSLMSRNSFGHTGFTGTSIWIDPERELYVILLTNRVHPSRENREIGKVRPLVADAVVAALTPPD
jgi:CubicO group peptidase (beta-lactamase class C family)